MTAEHQSTVFDYERYGVGLRLARQRAGFNCLGEFCDVVSDWTGIRINIEMLECIEKGVQPPTVDQLIAFGLVLFHGKGIANCLNQSELHLCITAYAKYLAEWDKPIYKAMTFDGRRAVFPPNEQDFYWEPIYPDERETSFLSEYYHKKLKG